jgi:hypothetical protein
MSRLIPNGMPPVTLIAPCMHKLNRLCFFASLGTPFIIRQRSGMRQANDRRSRSLAQKRQGCNPSGYPHQRPTITLPSSCPDLLRVPERWVGPPRSFAFILRPSGRTNVGWPPATTPPGSASRFPFRPPPCEDPRPRPSTGRPRSSMLKAPASCRPLRPRTRVP